MNAFKHGLASYSEAARGRRHYRARGECQAANSGWIDALGRIRTQRLEHEEPRMTGRVVRQLSENPIAEFLVEWSCLEAVRIQPDVPASSLHRRRLCRLYQSASPTLPAQLCRDSHRS